MRILMFGWEFPPYISGGLGTACFGITKGLSGLGQTVIFVLPKISQPMEGTPVKLLSAEEFIPPDTEEPAFIDEELPHKLKIRTVNSALRPYMNERQYQDFLNNIYFDRIREPASRHEMSGGYGPNLFAEVWRYGKAAESIAQKEHFDIIHGHDWTSVIACVRAQRISGKPYIYHAHALEFDRSGENVNPVVYDLEKYGMGMADHVIAVSHYTKENIVRRYGLAPEKITVVHNALSSAERVLPSRPRKKDKVKIVLFLGRITFQKGPDYFVEAASLVLQHIPGVRFVMAGAGDMMPEMIEKVAERHMGSKFHFTGFLSGEEVERMFDLSDLYVMPSVSEPFGISTLEAMRRDVPVIISKQSGVSEIMHHALRVDFWNVKELADKMIALLKHPSLRNEMSANAREELKNIKWEQSAAQIIDIYRQVLDG